jgi:hypothetical protein
VTENDWLTGAPVFVEYFGAVGGGNRGHFLDPFGDFEAERI